MKTPIPRSLAITNGISVDVFSLSYLDVSVHLVGQILTDFKVQITGFTLEEIHRSQMVLVFSLSSIYVIEITWHGFSYLLTSSFSKCLGFHFLFFHLKLYCRFQTIGLKNCDFVAFYWDLWSLTKSSPPLLRSRGEFAKDQSEASVKRAAAS